MNQTEHYWLLTSATIFLHELLKLEKQVKSMALSVYLKNIIDLYINILVPQFSLEMFVSLS